MDKQYGLKNLIEILKTKGIEYKYITGNTSLIGNKSIIFSKVKIINNGNTIAEVYCNTGTYNFEDGLLAVRLVGSEKTEIRNLYVEDAFLFIQKLLTKD